MRSCSGTDWTVPARRGARVNEAAKIERAEFLGAQPPYERTETQRHYANGFKPKTLLTRLGEDLPGAASAFRRLLPFRP